jgi:glycosyltransferase involved in cell wall biosynthesis
MLISIIVPVYNTQNYLSRCIKSLLNQTYRQIEIILIDDGSTDSSLEICHQLASTDSRLIVYHQSNKGVSAARNQGLLIASGDFVMFVDSDDYVDYNICQTLIESIKSSPSALTAFCGYHFVHSKNNIVTKTEHITPKRRKISSHNDFAQNYGHFLNNKIFLALWAKLFSLKIIKENHLRFDSNIHVGEDLLFLQAYYCALPTLETAIVNEALYYYDVKESGSLSSRFDLSRLKNTRIIFNEMVKFCRKMEITNEGLHFVALYYFRSCSVIIHQIFNDTNCILTKGQVYVHIKLLLNCQETRQALNYLNICIPEAFYYSLSFRLPIQLLRMLIRFRQWVIRKLRQL